MRVGIGFDVHKFVPHRSLFLGGVKIPYSLGLEGHSDADVLLHALMDALLGAISAGDIGENFPDQDERFKNASSLSLLSKVIELINKKGYRVVNTDIVAVLDEPKLNDFKREMETTIAKCLQIRPGDVSVKATTTEGLGFINTKEGAAALATVLVERSGAK